jgi:phage baseplate assembly protein gpV
VIDLAARELRTLRRQLIQTNGRLARMVLPGKVKPGSQDMDNRTVRLVLGTDEDGSEILSPPVRWPEPGAGRLQVHSVPADNEQMDLQSPSGTIGTTSKAIWATYDEDNPPPSQEADEAVVTFGESTVRLKADEARVKSPKVVVESNDVHLSGEDGQKVARVGDRVEVKKGSSKGLWPIVEGSSKVRAAG